MRRGRRAADTGYVPKHLSMRAAARRSARVAAADSRAARTGETAAPTPHGPQIVAVDLFCGAGGLTRGLMNAGVDVRLGVDLDARCTYAFEHNNGTEFKAVSVSELTGDDLRAAFGGQGLKLLAGCAPCQPFSTYSQARKASDDERWNLLGEFGRLVREVEPDFVTMENVPKLVRESVFDDFVSLLRGMNYEVWFDVVECVAYGIPQSRRRLVLLASKHGPIALVPSLPGGYRTVQEAIGGMARLDAGGRDRDDRFHSAATLSPKNLARIRASVPGGTWRDWPAELVADCHNKATGRTYPGVYGRMTWEDPSPTITTQHYGFGSGRFGHPEQDRGISLREGAILQSFPPDYEFSPPDAPVEMSVVGRMIGNAVPVRLGEAIGVSLVRHVANIQAT